MCWSEGDKTKKYLGMGDEKGERSGYRGSERIGSKDMKKGKTVRDKRL